MLAPAQNYDTTLFNATDPNTYRNGLDADKILFGRGYGARFAVHELIGSPNMSVVVEPGDVYDPYARVQTEVGAIAQCTTSTSSSPTVATNLTVKSGITAGMLAISPNYPVGTTVTSVASLASGQVTLSNNATASGSLVPIRFCQQIGGTYQGTTNNANGQITGLPSTADLATGMLGAGTGVFAGATISSVDSATQVTMNHIGTANGTASITFSIPAPAANPRIDLIVINGPQTATPGIANWVKGTEGASPSAPAIPAGTAPAAQILLQTSTTAITNAIITERRSLEFELDSLTNILSPASLGSSQNDYNPAGLAGAQVLRLTAGTAVNLTGLQGGASGRVMVLENIGSNAITLVDESGSSSAANRFALASNVALAADQIAVVKYDSTSSRWRLMSGPPPTSGPVIVSSGTISNAAEGTIALDFTTYAFFELKVFNLAPRTDNTDLTLRVQDASADDVSSNYRYAWKAKGSDSSTPGGNNNAGVAQIVAATGLDNGSTNGGAQFNFRISRQGASNGVAHINWEGSWIDNAGTIYYDGDGSGFCVSLTTFNGISLFMSSGNIDFKYRLIGYP